MSNTYVKPASVTIKRVVDLESGGDCGHVRLTIRDQRTGANVSAELSYEWFALLMTGAPAQGVAEWSKAGAIAKLQQELDAL